MEENFFDLNDREHSEIGSRIAHANAMPSPHPDEGMGIEYDSELDYLRIRLGSHRESLAFDLEDSARSILLYDPETYRIVGFEVPSFKAKINSGQLREEFWKMVAGLVEQYGDTIYVASAETSERAGRAFRELVPA